MADTVEPLNYRPLLFGLVPTSEPGVDRQHGLKTWPEFFEPLMAGVKTFELRLDDRGFRVGDSLHLREGSPETRDYTGRSCWRVITYITKAPGMGALNEGFVCLSIAKEGSDGG